MNERSPASATSAFRYLYALAFLGAHLAFMPLLILLLPRRVEQVAGPDATLVLSLLLILGAGTASVAHIVAGHASDRWFARHGRRRLPIALGVALLTASYAVLAVAGTIVTLTLALICFQVALNAMFAPLGALLSDHVDDGSKAQTSAWLTLALPLSIAASGAIGMAFPNDGAGAFVLVVVAVLACILPLLLFWPAIDPAARAAAMPEEGRPALEWGDFRLAFLARFLVQCGAALVLFYLYVYLAQLPATAEVPQPPSAALSTLVSVGGLAGALAIFAVGRISDRLQQRRWPIALGGMVAAGGLLLLAAGPHWLLVVLAYGLFSIGLMTFLSVDSAMVAQMLSGHPSRGRLLGIMNLTNTLPSVATPLLTILALQLASDGAITLLLAASAVATLAASLMILRMRSIG